MDRTKWPALAGLVLSTISLALEIPTTFALDKPIHGSVLALLSCAVVLIFGSRLLPISSARAYNGSKYDSVPLDDIGRPHASREPSPSPEDISYPSSLRHLRIAFLSLVIAVFLRVLILRQTLLHTQCAVLGWEPLIPCAFAIWDYWTIRRHQKYTSDDNLERSAYDDVDHHINQTTYRYVLATFLVGFGGIVALSAARHPSSTVVCAVSTKYRWFLSTSQFFGTLLDISILISTNQLLHRQEARSGRGISLRVVSVGFAALVSGSFSL